MSINPWAIILALIAIGALIVSYKGTQDNVFSALAGKSVGSPNISGSAGTTSSGTTTASTASGVALPNSSAAGNATVLV